MTQIALEFGEDARAAEGWLRFLRSFRAAVDAIGFKEVVARCDVQPSVLSEALADNGKRHVQARWLMTVLVIAPDPARKELLEGLASLAGYELKPRRKLSDAERLSRLEDALRSKLGKVGEQLIDEVGR